MQHSLVVRTGTHTFLLPQVRQEGSPGRGALPPAVQCELVPRGREQTAEVQAAEEGDEIPGRGQREGACVTHTDEIEEKQHQTPSASPAMTGYQQILSLTCTLA